MDVDGTASAQAHNTGLATNGSGGRSSVFPVVLTRETGCPVRQVLDRLGDAWSFLVVLNLGNQPMRFNALKRQINGISQRMLTLTLRKLERDGLVSRHVMPTTPPQVEYRLTGTGVSLGTPLVQLMKWASEHQPQIEAARAAYDAALGDAKN